jgi:hypothetical protein
MLQIFISYRFIYLNALIILPFCLSYYLKTVIWHTVLDVYALLIDESMHVPLRNIKHTSISSSTIDDHNLF